MFKSTIQQIILFIITSIVTYQSGKYLIAIDELESFKDLLILTIFFISMIFFINHLTRLMRKLIGFFSL
jgi:hypothetical protein